VELCEDHGFVHSHTGLNQNSKSDGKTKKALPVFGQLKIIENLKQCKSSSIVL
jgi:hypothetical protein